METQRPQIATTILRKKNRVEGIMLLTSKYTTKLQESKQYGTGTKTDTWGQWNRIESPEINPHTYGQFMVRR